MLDSIYVGLTGLTGYSKGLNNISNNVANLNTPGFKSSQLQFYDLFYQYQTTGEGGGNGSSYAQGSGMGAGKTSILYKQGELRGTGNDQDVAVDGNGLFVLRRDNETFYTRAGQFSFDDDGYLVSRSAQARVAGLTGNGILKDININGLRSNPPKATSTVKMSGTLSVNNTNYDFTTLNVTDGLGGTTTLNIRFDKNSTGTQWQVSVKNGTTVIGTGILQFQGGGPVIPGLDNVVFTFNPTNGAPPQQIKLDFSAVNSLSASASELKVSSQDGYGAGALTKAAFDEQGYLVLTYSNGQTVKNDRLALAWFGNMQALELIGGTMLANVNGQERILGGAGDSMFGKVRGGSIEASNVDLAQQFSELITTQRGYQASSQIISAANEMLQQLFDMRGKR